MPEQTIDQLLTRMDDIVDDCLLGASRLGFFAALYRRVTRTIHDLLGKDYFDDDARMEHLDVVFAGRWLAAVDDYVRRGPGCTAPWTVAIDAVADRRLIILQHLLVGMNAHIELDLGVACAEVAPGDALASLHADFLRINKVLAVLSPLVEKEIGDLSPAIHLAEKVGRVVEKPIVDTGMLVARTTAWSLAKHLAPLPPAERAPAIADRAAQVARWGRDIVEPPLLARAALEAIEVVESNDVRAIIRRLSQARTVRFDGLDLPT
ncbi:MAG: hypothetical protein H6739_18520 [Alphaproteobacteria bacterium]|nr:hypothetical protein [Alphaproteobacteria bacterium]